MFFVSFFSSVWFLSGLSDNEHHRDACQRIQHWGAAVRHAIALQKLRYLCYISAAECNTRTMVLGNRIAAKVTRNRRYSEHAVRGRGVSLASLQGVMLSYGKGGGTTQGEAYSPSRSSHALILVIWSKPHHPGVEGFSQVGHGKGEYDEWGGWSEG